MAHRQIAKLKSDNLSSIAYEYNGVVLDGIKVFRVKLSNAKIIPAALNQKFSTMANMNPLGASASKVMAKTNAATLVSMEFSMPIRSCFALVNRSHLLRRQRTAAQHGKMVAEFLIFVSKVMVPYCCVGLQVLMNWRRLIRRAM